MRISFVDAELEKQCEQIEQLRQQSEQKCEQLRQQSEQKCEQLRSERDEYFKANLQYQLERSQYLKDAISMYQRGIVELELQTFVHLPSHTVFDGDKKFRCDSKYINNDFTSVLRHWRECKDIAPVHWLTDYVQVRHAHSFLFSLRRVHSFPCLFRVHFVLQLWRPTWKGRGTISMVFCHHTIILMLANIPSKFIVWILMLVLLPCLLFSATTIFDSNSFQIPQVHYLFPYHHLPHLFLLLPLPPLRLLDIRLTYERFHWMTFGEPVTSDSVSSLPVNSLWRFTKLCLATYCAASQ